MIHDMLLSHALIFAFNAICSPRMLHMFCFLARKHTVWQLLGAEIWGDGMMMMHEEKLPRQCLGVASRVGDLVCRTEAITLGCWAPSSIPSTSCHAAETWGLTLFCADEDRQRVGASQVKHEPLPCALKRMVFSGREVHDHGCGQANCTLRPATQVRPMNLSTGWKKRIVMSVAATLIKPM